MRAAGAHVAIAGRRVLGEVAGIVARFALRVVVAKEVRLALVAPRALVALACELRPRALAEGRRGREAVRAAGAHVAIAGRLVLGEVAGVVARFALRVAVAEEVRLALVARPALVARAREQDPGSVDVLRGPSQSGHASAENEGEGEQHHHLRAWQASSGTPGRTTGRGATTNVTRVCVSSGRTFFSRRPFKGSSSDLEACRGPWALPQPGTPSPGS